MLSEQIRQLDDPTAVHLLNLIATTRIQAGGVQTELPPELAEAMRDEFASAPLPEDVTPGDLARDALLLLAQDPAHEKTLMDLLIGPETKSFAIDSAGVAVVTAALEGAVVLFDGNESGVGWPT